MKKLKAAIVGCGRISVSYADAFHRLSDEVELVYAVDKDPALAKAFAEEFNCSWTTDFDEILDKDIDVVHLCLPHFLHPVMATALIVFDICWIPMWNGSTEVSIIMSTIL